MISRLFDVHTHTQFAAFKDDADLVIQRALDAEVWMVNVGTQRDTSAKAIEFAEKYPEGVYATVGLHPLHTEKSYHDPQELGESPPSHSERSEESQRSFGPTEIGPQDDAVKNGGFTSRGEEFDYAYYKKLALHPKVVAIGECGLDYYRLGEETKDKQKSTFLQQIELAHDVKKPLMIHCRSGRSERTSPQNGAGRQAFGDLIKILQTTNYKLQPGIVHFFSGTKDDAQKLLDMGFSFSFGGVITFARDYDEVVKYIPLERILFETDAPYVAPVPYRGKRNEPAYVVEVAKKIAELRNVSLEEISHRATANARSLFLKLK